jgi:hypothetical protein
VDLLATAVGFEDFRRTRVRVVADVAAPGELRLVVQQFGRRGGWPVGAVERVVSASELRLGVDVQVVHDASEVGGRMLAWLEPNDGELEFGALTAVPEQPIAIAEAAALSGTRLVLSGTPFRAEAA